MKHVPEKFDFSDLSINERIALVESLWDGIYRDSQGDVPIMEEQKQELDSRLAADEAGELESYSWDEAKAWITRAKE